MSRSGKFFILWATIILMVFAVGCNYVQPRIMCSPARRSLTIMRRDGPLRQVAAPGRCA
jgi:hypothetical protein